MIDYTKDLRRLLAEGNTLDQSLAALRAKGAGVIACIFAIKKLRDWTNGITGPTMLVA